MTIIDICIFYISYNIYLKIQLSSSKHNHSLPIKMANLAQMSPSLYTNKVYSNTNQILYETSASKSASTFVYYMPAYMQLNFNSISKVDYSSLKSRVHCDIRFVLNVAGFTPYMIQFLKKYIRFNLNNDDSIQLTIKDAQTVNQQNQKQQQNDAYDDADDDDDDGMKPEVFFDQEKEYSKNVLLYHYIIFTVRHEFVTGLIADVDWTPFQLLDLILTVTPKMTQQLNMKELKHHDGLKKLPAELRHRDHQLEGSGGLKSIKFTFNLMDCPKNRANTLFNQSQKNYGMYAVANNKLRVQYTNKSAPQIILDKADEINNKPEQNEASLMKVNYNKIDNFERAHFIITVYKIPKSAVATIFGPIFLLCIINLGIFNQSIALGKRIANIATIMLAFVAVFPVIRQQIPPNPKITKMQILIYFLTGTDLLCLIQSVLIRGSSGFVQNIILDPFFLATLIISSIVLFCVIILLFMHYCKWEPDYLGNKDKRYLPDQRFDHLSWSNDQCDQHFMKFFDSGRVKAVERR